MADGYFLRSFVLDFNFVRSVVRSFDRGFVLFVCLFVPSLKFCGVRICLLMFYNFHSGSPVLDAYRNNSEFSVG